MPNNFFNQFYKFTYFYISLSIIESKLLLLGERRGIGGIFFDELNSPNQDVCFQFVSVRLLL